MHFSRPNMALRSWKRCQKNGTGELFVFAGSNNDICIISGLKIEKAGPDTGPQTANQLVTEQKNDLIFSYLRFRSYLSFGFIVHFAVGNTKFVLFWAFLGLFGSKNGLQKWPQNSKYQPKLAQIAQKCTFLGQILLSEAENGVRRTAPVSFLYFRVKQWYLHHIRGKNRKNRSRNRPRNS